MRAAKKIATINLVMSVCPFACMKKSESQVKDLYKISYLGLYTKICRDVPILVKSTKIRNIKRLPGPYSWESVLYEMWSEAENTIADLNVFVGPQYGNRFMSKF